MLVKAGEFQGRFFVCEKHATNAGFIFVDSRFGNGEVRGGHLGQTRS
jgi:hypothetical protein